MKAVFRRPFLAVIILTLSVFSSSSCKKKEGETGTDKFPLTNLTVSITTKVIYPNSNSVIVAYDVKNISSTNYTVEKYVLNPVKVRITIAATDGTGYESTLFVNNLEAGKTLATEQVVGYSAGKTVDLTKTKAELIY